MWISQKVETAGTEVTTWMDLEGIALSEIRERQILYHLSYVWTPRKKKKPMLINTENKLAIIRDEGWRMGETREQFYFFSLNKLNKY